jgi:hypothetical protein
VVNDKEQWWNATHSGSIRKTTVKLGRSQRAAALTINKTELWWILQKKVDYVPLNYMKST